MKRWELCLPSLSVHRYHCWLAPMWWWALSDEKPRRNLFQGRVWLTVGFENHVTFTSSLCPSTSILFTASSLVACNACCAPLSQWQDPAGTTEPADMEFVARVYELMEEKGKLWTRWATWEDTLKMVKKIVSRTEWEIWSTFCNHLYACGFLFCASSAVDWGLNLWSSLRFPHMVLLHCYAICWRKENDSMCTYIIHVPIQQVPIRREYEQAEERQGFLLCSNCS